MGNKRRAEEMKQVIEKKCKEEDQLLEWLFLSPNLQQQVEMAKQPVKEIGAAWKLQIRALHSGVGWDRRMHDRKSTGAQSVALALHKLAL